MSPTLVRDHLSYTSFLFCVLFIRKGGTGLLSDWHSGVNNQSDYILFNSIIFHLLEAVTTPKTSFEFLDIGFKES